MYYLFEVQVLQDAVDTCIANIFIYPVLAIFFSPFFNEKQANVPFFILLPPREYKQTVLLLQSTPCSIAAENGI